MHFKSHSMAKIGYTRREFSSIFQIYSHYVYKGFFRDFSFTELNGKYFISFKEDADQTPLITIEKKKISADKSLFVATSPAEKGTLKEIARSEKIDSFCRQLRQKIEMLILSKKLAKGNVESFFKKEGL